MTDRSEYELELTINRHFIKRVIIDQHYKENHPDVTDEIILELVASLDGEDFPVEVQKGDFEYLTVEPAFREEAPYRLIMVICIYDDYLGVINAFRVERGKHEKK